MSTVSAAPGARSPHGRVAAAIELVPAPPYRHLPEFDPPAVDFLLPHENWTNPPPGMREGAVPRADWPVAVFDRWYSRTERETVVRSFEEIVTVPLGVRSRVEGIGIDPPAVVVVETDGAAATGRHVARHSFDTVLGLPGVRADQGGPAALCGTRRVTR